MAKLKVGIIGMGAIGNVHARAYQATGEAEIAAVCDVDDKKASAAGEQYKVKAKFKDYHELLKADVEAVSICVGNVLHKEVALAALAAGKHVLLEKPMAMHAGQAEQIVRAAEKAKGILQIGMVNRQKAPAQVLRRYVEAGHLGEIYQMRCFLIRRRGIPGLGGWFTTKAQSGGGPMIDLGVHWFDMAMWLSGHWNPTAVSAKTYAKFGPRMGEYVYTKMWAGPPRLDGVFDVEDYSTGFVRFGEKASMVFDIAWAANSTSESYVEVMGDKGGAKILGKDPLTIYAEHEGLLADITPQFDEKVNAFEVQAKKFVAACRGQMEPAATGRQGLAVMKLLDSIYASSETNAEVKIDL